MPVEDPSPVTTHGPGKPVSGFSDLKLPVRADRRWAEPVPEPAFEEFRRWTELVPAARTGADLQRGIELARQRRDVLLELIPKNPRRALELAVPFSIRQRLPDEILALLEQPVDARGDLTARGTTFDNDRGCLITRTATLQDGRVYDTFTFGRRGAMPTRDNIAIHGVALDGKLALADLPGRVLEPAEVAAKEAAGLALEECPDPSGSAHQADAGNEVVIALGDKRMTRCCGESHAVAALLDEEGLEQAAAPMVEGDDLDGVIAYSPMTEGQKTLLIIRVDFPDFQGQVVGDATLQQLIADMNGVYQDMSSGKASFAPPGQGSAITPTVRLPNNASYYDQFGRILNAARSAAAAAGYNYLDYTYEVVVTGAQQSSREAPAWPLWARAELGCTTRSGISKPAPMRWGTISACRIPVHGTRMTAASPARARRGNTATSST